MTNYMLFWDIQCFADCREQKLSQQAKELMRLYSIPDNAPFQFVAMCDIDTREYASGGSQELQRILRQISSQVGYKDEWRLIVFFMKDIDLPHAGENYGISAFLSRVMCYESRIDPVDPVTREDCLVCKCPEEIWIVTLENEVHENDIIFNSFEREDETCYSAYPPNCRFLRYCLEFRLENSYSRELLKLHCGIRSLARDIIPADSLCGNTVYRMEVDLDEELLCDIVEQYDAWLSQIERAILRRERNLPIGTLTVETAPGAGDYTEARKPDILHSLNSKSASPEAAFKQMRETAARILEEDGQCERRLLLEDIEALQQWEEKQGHQVLSSNEEKNLTHRIERLELEMLKPENVRKRFSLMRFGDYLLNLRGKFSECFQFEGPESESAEASSDSAEHEFQYVLMVSSMMKERFLEKILHVAGVSFFCVLFVLCELNSAEISLSIRTIVGVIAVIGVLIVTVYLVYFLFYMIRSRILFRKIVTAKEKEVMRSRKYFNLIRKHLRLSWVLEYSKLQGGYSENAYAELRQKKDELKKYKSVCAQLKICCIGMQGSKLKREPQGNIDRMLDENSCVELFGLPGSLHQITLRGGHLTAAFPFVNSIHLLRYY